MKGTVACLTPALIVLALVGLVATGCASSRQTQPQETAEKRENQAASIDRLFAALETRSKSADFAGAREIADQIVTLARQSEGPGSLAEARALYSYALAALLQRDFAASDRAAEQALRIYADAWRQGRLPETAIPFYVETSELLADSLFFQRRFSEAVVFREALVTFYEPVHGPQRWRLLWALVQLAETLWQAGRYEEGNKQLSRAVGEWHMIRDASAEAPQNQLQYFGSQLLRAGYLTEAYDVVDLAVQRDESTGGAETSDRGHRLVLLGIALRERGDYLGAIDRLQHGADMLSRTLGAQHREAVSAMFQLGKTFLMAALPSTTVVVTTARNILWNVARIYLDLPESARTGFEFSRIELHLSLIQAETLAGNTTEAQKLAATLLSQFGQVPDAARDSYFNAELARDFLSVAFLLLRNQEFPKAERIAEYVARRLEALSSDHPLLPRAFFVRGLARAGQGDEAGAAKLLLRAIEIADHSFDRLLAGLSTRQRFEALRLSDHVDLLLSLPPSAVDAKTAYRVAVSRKNIVFRLAVDERPPLDADPHVLALYRDYNSLRRDLARLARATDYSGQSTSDAMHALAGRAEMLERQLSQVSSGFRRARAATRADFQEICSALGSNTALVEYVAFGRLGTPPRAEYTAFVLRGDRCDRGPLRFDLGPAEPIADAIRELRMELKVGLRGLPLAHPIERIAGRLSDLVLPAELRKPLSGVQRLGIAPDLDLATIPFAVLPGENGDAFLIESYAISYAASGRDLLRHDRAFASGTTGLSLFAVGNPEFGAGDGNTCLIPYDSLPGSEQEVKAVMARLNSEHGNRTELLGVNATKKRVVAEIEGKRILHFATHAFVGGNSCDTRQAGELAPAEALDSQLTAPLANAGLALRGANAGSADGVLTALELATLSLDQADLVVLSGCETGLGTINPGQELVGLRWAFMEAGAKSVVASLWEIPDEATVGLMTVFYDQLIKSGYRPITALREAQLIRLRDDRAHGLYRPWEWGTFTISVSYPEGEP